MLIIRMVIFYNQQIKNPNYDFKPDKFINPFYTLKFHRKYNLKSYISKMVQLTITG